MLTVEDIRKRLREIKKIRDDNDAAHGTEDTLYKDTLKAIARGVPNPETLATQALKAEKIEFERWYS